MKKFVFILTSISLLTVSLPTFAISGDTYVLSVVGSGTEKAQDYINEKIDLAPIKLPEKISHFRLLEAERSLAPNILKDQIGLWTAPLRINYKDLVWFIPAGGALTALLITDNDFSQALTSNFHPSSTQDDISKAFAAVGGYAPVLSLPGGLILTGVITKNDRLRETGTLQYEALASSAIIYLAASRMAGRNKPNNESKGRGEFFEGGSSFPSGHSQTTWALASVAAHQYPEKKWVPILGYTIATVISASRVTQGTHFPSDVFAGALTGYLIGKYVVKHSSQYSPKYKKKDRDK